MTNNMNQLRKELRAVGANPNEVHELAFIASRLHSLKDSRALGARHSARWTKLLKPAAFSLGGLISGMLLMVASQSVLPGSVLYPLQELTDSVAVNIHPAYRANAMMKRAQQVNELVANGADSNQVLTALDAYKQEAAAYKAMPRADYAAFAFCKANLEQAARVAAPSVRQAIQNSLHSLETT